MEELQKGLKALKMFANHRKNNNINPSETPDLPGTNPPIKEYICRDPRLQPHMQQRMALSDIKRRDALGPLKA